MWSQESCGTCGPLVVCVCASVCVHEHVHVHVRMSAEQEQACTWVCVSVCVYGGRWSRRVGLLLRHGVDGSVRVWVWVPAGCWCTYGDVCAQIGTIVEVHKCTQTPVDKCAQLRTACDVGGQVRKVVHSNGEF